MPPRGHLGTFFIFITGRVATGIHWGQTRDAADTGCPTARTRPAQMAVLRRLRSPAVGEALSREPGVRSSQRVAATLIISGSAVFIVVTVTKLADTSG